MKGYLRLSNKRRTVNISNFVVSTHYFTAVSFYI